MPKPEIKQKVTETAELLGLTEWIDRKPGQLSGGQRQRVAMGRAIVREPSVFLMDEPLSNLDAKLRVQMRAEVARIQRRVGVATLYVTHDQVEAMTMGDRVAVLRAGTLQQVRQSADALRQPKEPVRRRLHGLPRDEPLRGHVGEGASFGSHRQPANRRCRGASRRETRRCAATPGGPVVVGIRPEDLPLLRSDDARSGSSAFEGDVELVEALGSELLVHFTTDAHQVEVADTKHDDAEGLSEGALASAGEGVARVDARAKIAVGSRARFQLDPGRLHFFDPTTVRRS